MLTLLTVTLLICFAYLYFRTDLRVVKTVSEIFFWLLVSFSFAATMVSFELKAITSNWPLQDAIMARLDHAVGFDWLTWRAFVLQHPWLKDVLFAAYGSYLVQPLIAIIVLAIWRPVRGNSELFLLVALSATIVIITAHFIPTIGPSDYFGLPTHVGQTITSFREGIALSQPDTAAIAFPSLHTTRAVVYTYGVRGTPIFVPFLFLNLLMLLSIPYQGDHYAMDMVGGGFVAVMVIQGMRYILHAKFNFGRPSIWAVGRSILTAGSARCACQSLKVSDSGKRLVVPHVRLP